MTNPAYEATNSDVEKLIARIKPDVEIALDKQSTKAERYAAMDRVADLPGMMVVGKLIAALEWPQQEKQKWSDWAQQLGELADAKDKRFTELEAAPNAMMQPSNELVEMKRKFAELQEQKDKWAAWAIALGAKADELESRPLCVKSNDAMREAAPLCVKSPEDFPDDAELLIEIEFLDDVSVDIKTAQWLKELRRRRAGTVEG